ncbi:hypothetical protein YYC_01953 [Plasmodium yoelii 17X]|uniref:Sas10 C-terminal domain-containing protein n=1 Tax=Plasmodium yoelii 17X TaxID=1323249 RepID=V7PNJ6_PLAYE|nr:hypothetical protein YYC_01953 [Plasmodium yoelii 17X]
MKKKNYVPIDTNKVKFVEGSESEDIEIEEENDSDINNEIYDDNLVSDSDDESVNNINKKSKGKKKKKKLSSDEESQEDDFDDENEGEDLSDDDENENVENKEDEDFIKVSWKKDKKNYYQYESDNSSSDDDEENNDERMKEVIYLNKKEKENLNENDFDLYNIYMNEKDGISSKNKDNEIGIDEKENTIKKLINNMANELKEKKKEINIDEKDKKDIEEMIMNEHQEYQIILKELSLNIEKVFNEINENQKLFQFKNINENDVSPSDINKNTLLYLKKKNETMLTYIIYITYYVFLKVMNCYTHNHPVLDKLIYINTIISKTNELDNKIKFKIQQLNKLPKRQLDELEISSSDDQTHTKKNATGAKKIGKKSADNDDEYEEEEDGEDVEDEEDEEEEEEEEDEDDEEEEEEEEDEDDEDEEEDEEDEEDEDDEDEDDEEEEEEEEEEIEEGKNNKNKKYKVSKSIITEYTDSHIREKMKEEKKKQREKIKNERSIFLKEIKDMVSNKPEKIEEENYLKKLEEKFTDFDDKILRKKMKMMSKKKNRMNNLSNVGMTSNDLLKFVELPEMNNENDNTSFHENKIFRNNINKIKQKNKNKLMNNNANDDFVSFKKFNKVQNKNDSYDNKEQKPLNNYSFGKNMHNEIDDENIKNMLKSKKNRKEQRKTIMDKKNKEIRKQLVDQENEVNDRRMPNKNIIQNKGLVRKRKSTDGNARVHNKLKYMKKMKTYNSQHPKFKTHDNNYDGVKKGINPYLKKSIDIK